MGRRSVRVSHKSLDHPGKVWFKTSRQLAATVAEARPAKPQALSLSPTADALPATTKASAADALPARENKGTSDGGFARSEASHEAPDWDLTREAGHTGSTAVGGGRPKQEGAFASIRANTLMILPQVHLRKPCYDFYFL